MMENLTLPTRQDSKEFYATESSNSPVRAYSSSLSSASTRASSVATEQGHQDDKVNLGNAIIAPIRRQKRRVEVVVEIPWPKRSRTAKGPSPEVVMQVKNEEVKEEFEAKLGEKNFNTFNEDHLVNVFTVPTAESPAFPNEFKDYIYTLKEIGGEQQVTASAPHVQSRSRYGNFRLTLDSNRNFFHASSHGQQELLEGQPFILVSGTDETASKIQKFEVDHKVTTFVKLEQTPAKTRWWKALGQYRITSIRKARDEDFRSLSDARKEEVIQIFHTFYKMSQGTLTRRGMTLKAGLHEAEAKRAIRKALTRNIGLEIVYALFEFVRFGDNEAEMKDIEASKVEAGRAREVAKKAQLRGRKAFVEDSLEPMDSNQLVEDRIKEQEKEDIKAAAAAKKFETARKLAQQLGDTRAREEFELGRKKIRLTEDTRAKVTARKLEGDRKKVQTDELDKLLDS